MRIIMSALVGATFIGCAAHAGVFRLLDPGLTTNAVSGDGRYVVGYSTGPIRAMRFSTGPEGGFESLGTLGGNSNALAVSADGGVVGGTYNVGGATWRPFRWTEDGGMIGLGQPGVEVRGVSADGAVMAGTLRSPTPRAFRWTQDTGLVSLGLLNDATSSEALAASADGTVIVGRTQGGSTFSAFRWSESEGMVGLDVIAGASRAEALGVSEDGSVIVGAVGSNWFEPTEQRQAFRWTSDAGMTGLGVLDGFDRSSAQAVSADGSIVAGFASTADGESTAAFVWTADLGMTNLNSLLPTLGYSLDGWVLESVTGMSADGSVLTGQARLDESTVRSFVITGFLPAPGAASALALAGIATSRRKRQPRAGI